ncbi:MAG TPA: hypothetical protein VF120_08910 [Ktedonobacterales bacterium]
MLMPELLRDGAGVAPGDLPNGLAGPQGLLATLVSHVTARALYRATYRSVSRAAVNVIVHRNIIMYHLAHVSIVGGFTAAPALCLSGVGCLLLPAAQALRSFAGALVTLGALWTVLAIVVTHLRLDDSHLDGAHK